jgi:four helix bundle protein
MDETCREDIRERAFRFTCQLFDYCEDLVRNPGMARQVAYQLFDAGSSIGANLQEAKAAYSREFAAKNAISLKEARDVNLETCRHAYMPRIRVTVATRLMATM